MESLQKNKIKVALYRGLLRFAGGLANIPNKVTPPPFRLIQLGSAFWHSRALYAATKLGLADALGDGVKTTAELADELGLYQGHLYRLMRMLASLGIFTETEPAVFKNSAMSHYLRADYPNNVRAMILMHNSPAMIKPWVESLEPCIRNGKTPFVEANGAELFQYMDGDPAFDRLFSQAMDTVEALTGDAYLDDFDWSLFDRIIDVGGSRGAKSLAILRRQPHLRALVFDRPAVIEDARSFWKNKVEESLLERIEFVGGDLLESVPVPQSGRNIYLFMAVFHGFGDPDARQVLENVRRAIGSGSATVLIVDAVAAERGIDANTAAFDMQMLIGTRGRERTLPEWSALAADGGFSIREVVDVRTFAKFIVLRPS